MRLVTSFGRGRHPFYWGRLALIFLALLPLVLFGGYYLIEKRYSSTEQAFAVMLSARRSEVINLKLAGVEPFIWKPMLSCKGPASEFRAQAGCIPVEYEFTAAAVTPFLYRENYTLLSEKTPETCMMCHKQGAETLTWSFNASLPGGWFVFNSFKQSSVPVALAGVYYLLFASLLLGRYLQQNRKLVVVALTGSGVSEEQWQGLTALMMKMKFYYLYFEAGRNFARWVVPQYAFRSWLKAFFSEEGRNRIEAEVSADFLNRMKGAAFLANNPGSLPVPFENMKQVHAMSIKGMEGNFLVEKALLDKLHDLRLPVHSKKAVWRTSKGAETAFGFFKIASIR